MLKLSAHVALASWLRIRLEVANRFLLGTGLLLPMLSRVPKQPVG